MFASPYNNYFLRIFLASDDECDAPFSVIEKISRTEDRKPIATVYVSEPCRTKQNAKQLGFETGMEWIDKTLPLFDRPKTAAQKGAPLMATHSYNNHEIEVSRRDNGDFIEASAKLDLCTDIWGL